MPQSRRAGMQGKHDIGDRIGRQPAAAERNPGKIAASHRAQPGDQLSPEQCQDKPVVPH
ncbi:hypothetical protein [Mesorhizobium sp. WSM4313]|uniref:hypothetical protein n=1 Tax=Mesorhizobium sp. WSM4313 TaxID=2029412 RepID=UPI001596457B|nr:hypothetical protein [Mesorhizobium sp. WSM4313]